jgi:hypothetical protein
MMMRIMHKKGIRKYEPLDDEIVTAGPSVLKNAIEFKDIMCAEVL